MNYYIIDSILEADFSIYINIIKLKSCRGTIASHFLRFGGKYTNKR